MLFPYFGHQVLKDDEYAVTRSILEDLGSNSLDSRSARLVLMDRYESMFGIFDHERLGRSKPLSVVAMHPKEDATSYSKLYRTFFRYRQHRINEKFGLDIHEFLSLPHEFVELMFKVSTEETKAQDPQLDQLKKDLDKMGKA